VTACGTVTWGWPPAIYGTEEKSAAQAALEFLSLECTKKPCLGRLVERGPNGFRNMITFLIAPPVAKALAGAGYAGERVAVEPLDHRELEFLIDTGTPRRSRFPTWWRAG
jgi:hypothetical protein